MKRTITILICLLVVASFAVSALAVESVTMTLAADKTAVNRGDTVTFTISVPEVNCVSGGFSLDGLYDTDVFEFVEGYGHLEDVGDVEMENSSDKPSGFSNVGFIDGKLSGSFTYNAQSKTSGVIFTVKLRVKADAAFGKTTVAPVVALRNSAGAMEASVNALELEVICNHEWSDWTKADDSEHSRQCPICEETQTEAHSFTEKLRDDAHLVPGTEATYYYDCAHCDMIGTETFDGSYTPGDLDGNEAVDEDDAIYLLMYALTGDDEAFPINQTVDYDKNGDVNEDDAIYLLMYALTGDDEAFPLS